MGGKLPRGINGVMVVKMVAGMGPQLVGTKETIVCSVTRGPLGPGPVGPMEGIPVMIGGMDVSPLLTIPPWKGSGCALAMGLDGAGNKVGSD